MYRFIISIILTLSPLLASAQLFKPMEEGRARALRVSVDPTVPLKTFLQDADIMGLEATADMEIKHSLFAIGAFGVATTSQKSEDFNYVSNGMYLTLGADVNLTKRSTITDNDIFFIGLHYGFSAYTQEVTDIVIDNYWGDYTTSFPKEALNASWVEVAMGIKAEYAKNLYVGWTGKAKMKVSDSSANAQAYYIPGFGKNESNIAMDFNIYLSYAFAFKPRRKPLSSEPVD